MNPEYLVGDVREEPLCVSPTLDQRLVLRHLLRRQLRHPLTRERAEAFWRRVARDVADHPFGCMVENRRLREALHDAAPAL